MKMVRTAAALLGAASLILVGGGCNDIPVAGVLDSFTAQVTDSRSNTDAVKLDFLWVIDNSVSMCQEQNALAGNIATFLDKIQNFVNVDVRLAVVTTDAISESERGKFHHKLPPAFPPACLDRKVVKCLTDEDCEKALNPKDKTCLEKLGPIVPTPAEWVCEPPGQGAQYLVNKNGSVNSTCRYFCTEDAGCGAELEPTLSESTYMCLTPGGDKTLSGCLKPPAIDDCPKDLPEFVDADVAKKMGYDSPEELFRCMAIVGALQDQNPQLEQGLMTATLALDVNGPNAKQAQKFLRPDAYQIIIFVSDEEDCSIPDGTTLAKELWQTCGLLGDTDKTGPCGESLTKKGKLEPVSTFVNKLRNVNPDPSRVLVAAIVGNVVVDPDGKEALSCDATGALKCPDSKNDKVEPCKDGECPERCTGAPSEDSYDAVAACVENKVKSYIESKGGPGPLAKNTYVCESPVGKADWGGRYLKFVRAFGKNGVSTNICNPKGFEGALDQIADTILRRVIRICLEEHVKPGTEISVTKTFADGTVKALEAGEEKDYVVRPSDDCTAGQAVFFNDVLEPKETVQISYEAPLIETPATVAP